MKDQPRIAKQNIPEGFWRLSILHFLIALVLLLLTVPFVLESPGGKQIESAFITVVLLSGVLAVGGSGRRLIAGALISIPAVAGTWLDHFQPNYWPKELTLAAALVFATFVIIHLLKFIMSAPHVDFQVLCAGISNYLMLAMLWSFAYTLVARLIPQAFAFSAGPDRNHSLTGFEALYFSFCTLTTVGYGDIVPLANAARMLAMLEAATGTIYVTVLIARLVALYSAAPPES